jgi:uncharacterized protein (DUF58 family)
MLPTFRAVSILLLAAPIFVLGKYDPIFEKIAGLYLLAMIGMLIWDWRLAGNVKRFEVKRIHDNKLSLGIQNIIRLEVRNRHHRAAQFEIRDEPPEAFQIEKRILKGKIPARQNWEGIYRLTPLRRGDYLFGDISLRWLGPLGLVQRQATLPFKVNVKVYPNLLDIHRYELLLRRNRLHEMGLRTSRAHGEGTEFERLRDYLPDDEFKRINWKATARRNMPVTTEYQVERSQNVIAVVDTGRMMQSPVANIAKLDYVVNAVLFLSYVAAGKGDRMGLMTFADDVQTYLSPKQGRGQFYRMLETLYRVDPQPVEPDYKRALSYLAVKQRRRSLVIIFTDIISQMGVNQLLGQVSILARHSLPLVVTISDPDVHQAAENSPHDSLSVYQHAIANQMLEQRRLLLDSLRLRGVLTLDVPANQLSMAVINRYLELKARTQL